jgi:ABC-2 type transport system ATP-binding protein
MTRRLSVRRVSRVFPGGAGVHDIDLEVAAGEIHALVGLNGAGKSTLMRLILGMLVPDAGEIELGGVALAAAGPAIWARVGHLVEFPLAYPELSARANLLLSARLHGLRPAAARAAVTAVLVELELGQYAEIRTRRLSLGNRQRAGLAAALQHNPDLIVLDEPSNALDPAGVIRLREGLLRRAGAGAGILVSSHHLDEVARVADTITVINGGRVVGTLDPDGIDIERAFFAVVHGDDVRSGR